MNPCLYMKLFFWVLGQEIRLVLGLPTKYGKRHVHLEDRYKKEHDHIVPIEATSAVHTSNSDNITHISVYPQTSTVDETRTSNEKIHIQHSQSKIHENEQDQIDFSNDDWEVMM
jgi:hypothetical protein